MITAMTGHVISGGRPGYDRLRLPARERCAGTRALPRAGGMRERREAR